MDRIKRRHIHMNACEWNRIVHIGIKCILLHINVKLLAAASIERETEYNTANRSKEAKKNALRLHLTTFSLRLNAFLYVYYHIVCRCVYLRCLLFSIICFYYYSAVWMHIVWHKIHIHNTCVKCTYYMVLCMESVFMAYI